MVAVPFATEVTRPVDDTVATAASDVVQVTVALGIVAPFWFLTVAVSWVVSATEAKVSSDADNSMLVATGVELGPVVLSAPHAALKYAALLSKYAREEGN